MAFELMRTEVFFCFGMWTDVMLAYGKDLAH